MREARPLYRRMDAVERRVAFDRAVIIAEGLVDLVAAGGVVGQREMDAAFGRVVLILNVARSLGDEWVMDSRIVMEWG